MALQDAYTGVNGILEIDSVAVAIAEFSVKITRGSATHARSGKWSDYKLPGKIDVTGQITRIMVDGTMLGYLLSATSQGGAAETLHAGLTYPTASTGENITDMTDTSIASPSRISFKAKTAAITTVGKAIVYGTDANGNDMTELISIPALGINESITGTRAFKTVTHVALFGVNSATGTLEVTSVAGGATITPAEPKFFNLVGKVVDGTNHVYVTLNNCYLTDGEFAFSDADKIVEDKLSFTMRDAATDMSVESVNA